MNPEVRASSPRVAVVREQIFALNSMSNRLRSAFNGHDVEWVDNDESWSSGSGSGSGSLEPITDDEDGFAEEGSGFEVTPLPTLYPELVTTRPRAPNKLDPVSNLPSILDGLKNTIEFGSSSTPDSGSSPGFDFSGAPTLEPGFESGTQPNDSQVPTPTDGGAAAMPPQISLLRTLTTYLLPIVVIWFGGCFTEWL